jgi:hypothetical protein
MEKAKDQISKLNDPKAQEFEKLLGLPVETSIGFGTVTIKCWMHELSDNEVCHCVSVSTEQHDTVKKDGGDDARANNAAYLAYNVQLIKYAIRKEVDSASRRLFNRAAEILNLPPKEFHRLLDLYAEKFSMSPEALGNLLRARTDTSSTN